MVWKVSVQLTLQGYHTYTNDTQARRMQSHTPTPSKHFLAVIACRCTSPSYCTYFHTHTGTDACDKRRRKCDICTCNLCVDFFLCMGHADDMLHLARLLFLQQKQYKEAQINKEQKSAKRHTFLGFFECYSFSFSSLLPFPLFTALEDSIKGVRN